ncbi:hypothetical protein M0805_001625 [Coniferiporia weirii]|nr:hypothetical protein M0805_001625 [Coniferiporia weirii]
MDNSVYQPLSHALQPPPTSASRPTYAQDTHAQQQQHQQQQPINDHDSEQDARADTSARHEEEEEEEEEEVEGTVDHPASASTDAQTSATHGHTNAAPARRRPGRPKGSKNKKPRYDLSGSPPKQQFTPAPFYGYAPAPHPGAVPMQPNPPPHPVPVPYPAPDASNQAFYDFQWRVLTLCSEFYNAADELIRGAPQHIIHQCFSLPGNQVDPITILHEARRACDQLMANPSQAVLKVTPTQTPFPPPVSPAKDNTPPAVPAAPIITNPGSFVMSLSNSPTQGSYTGFQPPNRYPTTPYYSYATQPHQPGAHPYMAQQQVMKPVNLSTPAAAGNQGAWSEEETEKLKRLAEESKTAGTGTDGGEIDWDRVCSTWGPGRTRHQILIKATNMGLKESSTRGMKRRRETDPGPGATDDLTNNSVGHAPAVNGNANPNTNATTQAVLNAVGAAAAASSGSSSVSSERPTSTSLSPATAQQQAPPPPPAPPGGGNLMHWPMPHIAANTPSPVIAGNTQGSRSVYYNRDRANAGPKA